MKNDIMISVDAKSLLTNMLVREAIELSVSIIMEKKQFDKNYTKLAAKDVRSLSELAVTNTPFRSYDKLYMCCSRVWNSVEFGIFFFEFRCNID